MFYVLVKPPFDFVILLIKSILLIILFIIIKYITILIIYNKFILEQLGLIFSTFLIKTKDY